MGLGVQIWESVSISWHGVVESAEPSGPAAARDPSTAAEAAGSKGAAAAAGGGEAGQGTAATGADQAGAGGSEEKVS